MADGGGVYNGPRLKIFNIMAGAEAHVPPRASRYSPPLPTHRRRFIFYYFHNSYFTITTEKAFRTVSLWNHFLDPRGAQRSGLPGSRKDHLLARFYLYHNIAFCDPLYQMLYRDRPQWGWNDSDNNLAGILLVTPWWLIVFLARISKPRVTRKKP